MSEKSNFRSIFRGIFSHWNYGPPHHAGPKAAAYSA